MFKRKDESLTFTFSNYISYYFFFFHLQFKTHTILMTAIPSISIRAVPCLHGSEKLRKLDENKSWVRNLVALLICKMDIKSL